MENRTDEQIIFIVCTLICLKIDIDFVKNALEFRENYWTQIPFQVELLHQIIAWYKLNISYVECKVTNGTQPNGSREFYSQRDK